MVIPRKCKNGTMQVGTVRSEWECVRSRGCHVLLQGPYRAGLIRVLPRCRWCLQSLRFFGFFFLRLLGSELNSCHSNSPQRTSSRSPGRSASAVFFFPNLPIFFSLFLIYSLALILFENNYLQLSLALGSS